MTVCSIVDGRLRLSVLVAVSAASSASTAPAETSGDRGEQVVREQLRERLGQLDTFDVSVSGEV